jgi:hypothetical protein
MDRIKKGEILKEEKIDNDYIGYIKDGVEVVDVKAIPLKKRTVDKFGIPTPDADNRKSWDRI